MKFINTLLPLAALTTAFVIPDESVANQLVLESKKAPSFLEKLKGDAKDVWSNAETKVNKAVKFSENALDSAIDVATGVGKKAASSFECYESMMRFETQEWLNSATDGEHDHPPHHGPPHRRPKHDPHHHAPNKTVYELIASSKYTTKLAKLINEYPDLVKALNGTAANFTIFAPTDEAFEKIPKHHKDHKPSKEIIEKILSYHVSTDFYPAGRVLVSHTIPTLLKEEALGGESQRLRVGLGWKGLAVNFYSRIVAVNIFGTNGVIHGVDSLLLPPPPALKIVELLPGEFSTLQLGLVKTGLFDAIKKANHTGGTLFAPSNFAFKKLGPRINAFLFSSYGEKYLKALLEYHVVANQTLYSDAFYKADGETANIPKGHFHIDLPTLLKNRSLSIDIARWGGFITIKINGFNGITVQDGIAKDGVIHVVGNVLIPPKTPGGAAEEAEEMDVEEFKERLIPSQLAQEL